MVFHNRTYLLPISVILCVLWQGCKDPSPVVFHQDIPEQIGPFESISSLSPTAAMLTTIDSSGWRIIDTSYTAMALLSEIQFDSGATHNRTVLSKIIFQDKNHPVIDTDQNQFLGFYGMALSLAYAGSTPMHQEKRHVLPIPGLPDSALGFQYSAMNINGNGPDAYLVYPPGRLYDWTVRIPGWNPTNIGGIASNLIRFATSAGDTIERIDKSKDYTLKWAGPNESVDLVISEYSSGDGKASPKVHANFQRVSTNTVTIGSDTFIPLYPGLYLFTLSASTEVSSEVDGVPVTMRFSSVHNIVVRLQ